MSTVIRLASAAQRIVLLAKGGGRTFPGCTVPGYTTQVHHAVADWKNNGQTNITDLTLACKPRNLLIENSGRATHPERYLLPKEDDEDG